jgi:hypothetical protein
VSIFGAKRPNHGNYSVILDGVKKMTGNGAAVDHTFNQSLVDLSNLPYGKHDVVITNDESMYLDLDYIVVTSGDGDAL